MDINSVNTVDDLLELQKLISNDSSYEVPIGKITRSNLINAWENNILSDKAYVFLIICMFCNTEELSHINIYEISQLWEGMGLIEGKLPKQLRPESINKALIDIQAANIISIQNGQTEFNIKLHSI
jgi:hypothetical protein